VRRVAFLVPLLAAAPALAHDGQEHAAPGWTLDPLVLAPLLIGALVYAWGLARLLRRAGRGGPRLRRDARLFGAGWLVLALALVTPLHEAGERSFTMHMIEHELIMLVAALLIVAGRPGPALLWGLPPPLRGAGAALARWPVWRMLADPVVATVLQALAIWAWHAPALFDRALGSDAWHIAQHLSFVVTALLFWWAMLFGRSGQGVAILCLFLTAMVGGLLGALMALSSSPWYAGYAALGLTAEGLSPAQDQQLAGLIMWLPGGTFHLAAALWLLWKWLKASEVRDARPA
jgi:cytochrome c oxidase assembly factor CtaG